MGTSGNTATITVNGSCDGGCQVDLRQTGGSNRFELEVTGSTDYYYRPLFTQDGSDSLLCYRCSRRPICTQPDNDYKCQWRLLVRWLWVLLLAPTIAFAGVGSIEHNEGRTWNERQNKTENIDLGYDVLMDDFYQTGEDGQIGIIFADETSVTVIENSELLIDDFVYDPATGAGSLSFNVTVGSFRYVSGALAAANAGDVSITTPSATITVRGTTLTGNVTPSGATTITLLRDADGGLGLVNVANRAGSVMLTRPFHTVTVASINTRPPLPTIPSPRELRGMNLIIEPVMDEPVVETTRETRA